MNSTERAINKKIREYNEFKLLNTDNISDGMNTFGELYEQLHKLEQALNTCTDKLIECQSPETNIV